MAVEIDLRFLPIEKQTREVERKAVNKLRDLLHRVLQIPYCGLVHSFSLDLQIKIRRLRACSYKLSQKTRRKHQQELYLQGYRELSNLCVQIISLKQQEIEILRDQVASYRHLRMAGVSPYGRQGQ